MLDLIRAFVNKQSYQCDLKEPDFETFSVLKFGSIQDPLAEFELTDLFCTDTITIFELLIAGHAVFVDATKMSIEHLQLLNALYGILLYQNYDSDRDDSTIDVGSLLCLIDYDHGLTRSIVYDVVFGQMASFTEQYFVNTNMQMTNYYYHLIDKCYPYIPFSNLFVQFVDEHGDGYHSDSFINYTVHSTMLYFADYISKYSNITFNRAADKEDMKKYLEFVRAFDNLIEDTIRKKIEEFNIRL